MDVESREFRRLLLLLHQSVIFTTENLQAMFTGLIEQLCTVTDIQALDSSVAGGGGHSITVGNAQEILTDCNIGDSIAVNGKCTHQHRPPEPCALLTLFKLVVLLDASYE